MNYVDWYNNHRLHSLLDLVRSEEFEQAHYAHNTDPVRRRRQQEDGIEPGGGSHVIGIHMHRAVPELIALDVSHPNSGQP